MYAMQAIYVFLVLILPHLTTEQELTHVHVDSFAALEFHSQLFVL